MMMRFIRSLAPTELWRYRDHLLDLPADDRRLRFGIRMDDAGISRFVAGLPPDRIHLFVVEDAIGDVVAAVLIAVHGRSAAELAFSVLPGHRRRGHARALFLRALLWGRNRRIGTIHLACLAENRAMRNLARDMAMTTRVTAGEAEASLQVPAPSPFSLWREIVWEASSARRRAFHLAYRPMLQEARLAIPG